MLIYQAPSQLAALVGLLAISAPEDDAFTVVIDTNVTYRDVLAGQDSSEAYRRCAAHSTAGDSIIVYEVVLGETAHGGYILSLWEEGDGVSNPVCHYYIPA